MYRHSGAVRAWLKPTAAEDLGCRHTTACCSDGATPAAPWPSIPIHRPTATPTTAVHLRHFAVLSPSNPSPLPQDIAFIARRLRQSQLADEFKARASARHRALNAAMWSHEDGCWHDLLLLAPMHHATAATWDGQQRQQDTAAPAVDGSPHVAGSSATEPGGPVQLADVGQDGLADGPSSRHVSREPATAASNTNTSSSGNKDPRPPPARLNPDSLLGPMQHLGNPMGCSTNLQDKADTGTAAAVCTNSAHTNDHSHTTTADCDDQLVYYATQRRGAYVSNWVPLWCGVAARGSSQAADAVAGLRRSGLLAPGGVLTSLVRSGQQWDAPNAWPPLVHMVVEGVEGAGVEGCGELAREVAEGWVRATLAAWVKGGVMHEKLDAEVVGGVGGGGEYAPQVGFGWSNGVLLELLSRYWGRG